MIGRLEFVLLGLTSLVNRSNQSEDDSAQRWNQCSLFSLSFRKKEKGYKYVYKTDVERKIENILSKSLHFYVRMEDPVKADMLPSEIHACLFSFN